MKNRRVNIFWLFCMKLGGISESYFEGCSLLQYFCKIYSCAHFTQKVALSQKYCLVSVNMTSVELVDNRRLLFNPYFTQFSDEKSTILHCFWFFFKKNVILLSDRRVILGYSNYDMPKLDLPISNSRILRKYFLKVTGTKILKTSLNRFLEKILLWGVLVESVWNGPRFFRFYQKFMPGFFMTFCMNLQ